MNTDPVAFKSESVSDRPTCSRAAEEQPGAGEAHVQRIAELFRDEYGRLVHYMVARTRSWPEARGIAAQAFAQVLEMRDPETVSFLKAYVYRATKNLATDRAKSRAIRNRIDRVARQELPGTSSSPEPLLMQQQRLQVLERGVGALRPTCRMPNL